MNKFMKKLMTKITFRNVWHVIFGLSAILTGCSSEGLPDLQTGIREVVFWGAGLLFAGVIGLVLVWYFFLSSVEDVKTMSQMRRDGAGFGKIAGYAAEAAGTYFVQAATPMFALLMIMLVVVGAVVAILVGLLTLWNSLFPETPIEIPDIPFFGTGSVGAIGFIKLIFYS